MNLDKRKILEFAVGVIGGFIIASVCLWMLVLVITKGTFDMFDVDGWVAILSLIILLLVYLVINLFFYKKTLWLGLGVSMGLIFYISCIYSQSVPLAFIFTPFYYTPPLLSSKPW